MTEHDCGDIFKLINQKVKIDPNILHISNVGRCSAPWGVSSLSSPIIILDESFALVQVLAKLP